MLGHFSAPFVSTSAATLNCKPKRIQALHKRTKPTFILPIASITLWRTWRRSRTSCLSSAVGCAAAALRVDAWRWSVRGGVLAGKAGHSESLMKRDSEVCWSRMRLSLPRDPSEPRARQSVIECCCWAVVKSQLNSSSIIITICFPQRERGGWDPDQAAGRLFSSLLTRALQCCQCFWWPSHHDFTSELIPAIGHVWQLVRSRRRRLHSGNTRFITSLLFFSLLVTFKGAFVTFLAASDRYRLIEILQQLPIILVQTFTFSRGWIQTLWSHLGRFRALRLRQLQARFRSDDQREKRQLVQRLA